MWYSSYYTVRSYEMHIPTVWLLYIWGKRKASQKGKGRKKRGQTIEWVREREREKERQTDRDRLLNGCICPNSNYFWTKRLCQSCISLGFAHAHNMHELLAQGNQVSLFGHPDLNSFAHSFRDPQLALRFNNPTDVWIDWWVGYYYKEYFLLNVSFLHPERQMTRLKKKLCIILIAVRSRAPLWLSEIMAVKTGESGSPRGWGQMIGN